MPFLDLYITSKNLYKIFKNVASFTFCVTRGYFLPARALNLLHAMRAAIEVALTSLSFSILYIIISQRAKDVGLIVNDGKIKYLGTMSLLAAINFIKVKDFVYLGTSKNSTNYLHLEIKRRITFANRYYSGISKRLRSR